MVVQTKADGQGSVLISRELAVDVGGALYEPHIGAHVPGMSNAIAEKRSRQSEVGWSRPLPPWPDPADGNYFPHHALGGVACEVLAAQCRLREHSVLGCVCVSSLACLCHACLSALCVIRGSLMLTVGSCKCFLALEGPHLGTMVRSLRDQSYHRSSPLAQSLATMGIF